MASSGVPHCSLNAMRRLCLVLGLSVVLCAAAGVAPGQEAGDAVGTDDAAEESRPSAQELAADRLVRHFVRMYGEHLKSHDWMARAMAVVGLSQILDPRTTPPLVETLAADTNKLVRVYAWEALFARHGMLDDAQRAAWVEGGKELAKAGALRGDLRVGLVYLVGCEAPTQENRDIFIRLFERTNSMDPADVRTLYAMRDVLGRWKSPELVKGLINAMQDLDRAYRAELVLGGLDAKVPAARSLIDRGTKTMWEKTREAWIEWFKGANLQEAGPDPKAWTSRESDLIPSPERIEDPSDPRWRKDLELAPLRLKQLDVVFAVDSTGSMGPVIRWMRRNVIKMMRAMAIISREPRIGVVFYRDHGDAYVVKPVPLTGNAEGLVGAIDKVRAKGGGDVPEAVYEALATAAKGMKWASSNRIIITVGDAPPHPGAMDKARQLVTASAEKGYRFHFVKARTQYGSGDLKEFDSLAALGKGSSNWVEFFGDYSLLDGAGGPAERFRYRGPGSSRNGSSGPSREELAAIASVDYAKDVDRKVVAAVLRSVLSEAYHDRVAAFVSVLMEYVERPVPENRRSFPRRPKPKPTTHTGGPARPAAQPHKPKDPQAR